jgi:hypothetical protein
MALFLLLLSGCGEEGAPVEEEQPQETVQPTETPEPEDIPEPVITPEPTPVVVLEPSDYAYSKVNNQSLDVSFKYPSHWTNVPGTYTISYIEPVEEGDVPSRVAVTTKPYEGKMTKDVLKQEAKDYSAMLSTQFDKYDRDSVTTSVNLLGHTAYSFQFTGEIEGQDIQGFACVGFGKTNGKLYALNFYSVKKKFRHFDVVRRMIVGSVAPAS